MDNAALFLRNALKTFLSKGFRVVNYILSFLGLRLMRTSGRGSVWSFGDTDDLPHSNVFTHATYSPWLADKDFLNIYHKIRSNTLVDIYRCYELWNLSKQAASLDGDLLEVGVWRGGTGCLIASAVRDTDKTVFLADTFSGVVKVSDKDPSYQGGEHADTTEKTVLDLLAVNGIKNARILKGVFPDENADKITGQLALLHIDVDVYESAKQVYAWSLQRLSNGSVIIFDDYGFHGCEGVTRLVNEIRQTNKNFYFVHNLNGHALLVKTS